MKRIAILGSTGSIGRSTLSVVESYPDRFEVVTLAAGNNTELAFEQAVRWKPRVLSLADESAARVLKTRLQQAGLTEIEVVHGMAGTVRVATDPDADLWSAPSSASPGWRRHTKRCERERRLVSPIKSAW